MHFRRGHTRGAVLVLAVAAAAVTIGPVPLPARAEEASPVEPTEYVTSFQAQFIIDPVAKTLVRVPLGVQIDTLGPTGETVSTASVPLALSAEPVPPPAGSGTPTCGIDGNTASEVHPYEPTYAYLPRPDAMGVYMYYQYQTYQLDDARFVAGQPKRQYVQCVAGGGSPRTGAQARNGGGTTMEDTDPHMLLPCNPSDGYGCAWGTGLDAADPPKAVATLNFELAGTVKTAKTKAGVTIPVTTGGGGWTGAQGPLPSSALRDDPLPSRFEVNEVNGWWYTDGETTNYRGNVSQSLWEYSMSDTTPRTIRGSAWMRHHCGFFGCDKTTYYFPQPTPVPVAHSSDGPSVSISDVSVDEAELATTVSVTLSEASELPVAVGFTTSDGSASGRSDYVPASGTIVFLPTETKKSIDISLIDEYDFEADESFFVDLSNEVKLPDLSTSASGSAVATATIADGQGAITIENDDNLVSVQDVEASEGRTANFTVFLSNPTVLEARVNYATVGDSATAGSDFISKSGTLIYAPGEWYKVVSVSVLSDTLKESDETFFLKLSAPTNAELKDPSATATIAAYSGSHNFGGGGRACGSTGGIPAGDDPYDDGDIHVLGICLCTLVQDVL